MARKKPTNSTPRIANRRAYHDYIISDKLEVGVQLLGSEVKSIRTSQVSLAEGFARVEPRTMELVLYDVDIARYPHASVNQHDPKRPRRLLAHRRQIQQLHDKTAGRGATIVPLALYFVRGRVKLEIGVGVGKKTYDKRQTAKKREADREIQRGMTRRIVGP